MEIDRQSVHHDPLTGSTETIHTESHVPSAASVDVAQANKANAFVWYIVGIIEALLALRLLFLLFGAHNTGFAAFLYSLTLPFMTMFRGIFPAPGTDTGYFDTATLLAMIVYLLIGWAIASLISISKKPVR